MHLAIVDQELNRYPFLAIQRSPRGLSLLTHLAWANVVVNVLRPDSVPNTPVFVLQSSLSFLIISFHVDPDPNLWNHISVFELKSSYILGTWLGLG